ncbi:TetR family transcriptional regulator [Streptomyces sp. TRM43335]|uniref:TetR family transcriptional regulator n=1 Tax=Streptomyces taklimakanensis TaxID=2569853 RepID=A0A6G2BCZ2_9ACTN|nr:helix-turn-helix domain-containing protein [Streptomyces taklimakanensis]MTE19772.1 TetR family transcriptional regulator [Streptomyces taklimakanensis]
MHVQGIQGSHWPTAVTADPSGSDGGSQAVGDGSGGAAGRTAPLRVDAQRNLEHVLRAAREVFGELGYGAPMEDVARRARVGVGTVYRRFPSKEVLVRRIAEEETARLTEQARVVLGQERDAWSALSRFLRASVASGAGRLLPPRILKVDSSADEGTGRAAGATGTGYGSGAEETRSREGGGHGQPGLRLVDGHRSAVEAGSAAAGREGGAGFPARIDGTGEDANTAALLEVVGQLVARARSAGELRSDVTVSDVLLVMATAAPSLPNAAQQAAASARLLDILLEGLRPRSAKSAEFGAGHHDA